MEGTTTRAAPKFREPRLDQVRRASAACRTEYQLDVDDGLRADLPPVGETPAAQPRIEPAEGLPCEQRRVLLPRDV
eukprot:CAMPEP_0113230960 /NCGR_PEP_ID=MMETSP0008_2-20120614/1171_1 /TAXON_ID=97485 /ORGANISM="Prymnesium parvum" /LENGTH=75 /DNA_ID=CAMNT_0000077595 /DNA_START=58 /DNA_END=286 /DNA_ORIENTATION=- /assembly_acc=CAM_ASM_000153